MDIFKSVVEARGTAPQLVAFATPPLTQPTVDVLYEFFPSIEFVNLALATAVAAAPVPARLA